MEEKEKSTVYFDLEKVPLKSEREEIRRKRNRRLLTLFLCLLFFLIGFGGSYLLRNLGRGETGGDTPFNEIKYLMENYYLYSDQYDNFNDELEEKAYYGMTAFSDDPYTGYMSKEEMNDFSSSINMNYVGIGVEYANYDDMAMVVKVFKDSPAEKAGMLPGDILEIIEGRSVSDLDSQGIKDLVLGEAGTIVNITVNRGNERIKLRITRGAINSTVYAYTEDDYVVLELNSFGEDSASECMHYLDDLTSYEKIIIDLRNNSGGYQTAVKDICGLFIGPDKVYLKQKGLDGKETSAYTGKMKQYTNFNKYILLTNENTASAAEVFAICLKEQLDNVTIVGTTTYGKGVIQTNHLLSNGGALKMTTYYWYSPNGVSIDKEGVKPDVEVKMPDIYYETYVTLDDDEYYEYDSVSSKVRIIQLALQYLDYGNKRNDGYFDKDFEVALNKFKADHDYEEDGILDKRTFETAISMVSRTLSMDKSKDSQLNKAKELMNEN